MGAARHFAIAVLILLSGQLTSGCASERGGDVMDSQDLGDGPFQRFIVQYRADSAAGRSSAEAAARLARTVEAAKLSPAPTSTWQRRLAVGADVFSLDRAVDADTAAALMQAFRADPDVDYIEVDRMMGIGPQPRMPMRERD
jgi:hypothetical protein